jgi:N4-gp56 family major capsid protein
VNPKRFARLEIGHKSNRVTRDAYFALCHTNLTKAFDSVNGFIAKAQYPSQMNVLRSEWGSISNLRFLVSSLGSITYKASEKGKNVYNIFCVGLEAYAVIDQDRYSSSFIYRPPMFSDPLAQNASVGYKFAQVPKPSGHVKSFLIDLETYVRNWIWQQGASVIAA